MADDPTSVPEGPTIGLLGATKRVRSTLASYHLLEGPDAIAAADVDVIVAVGERGLGDRLGVETAAPTLPVDVDSGVAAATIEGLPETLEGVLAGGGTRIDRPVLAVSIDGTPRDRALFDVSLVSDRPAHISEFRVARADRTVLETRADGVVVATPAGSHGYARAAGGGRVATGTEALSIVPISAFATSADRWITPLEPLTLTVEREETPVAVRVDDRVLDVVSGGATVEVAPEGTITTLVAPETGSQADG